MKKKELVFPMEVPTGSVVVKIYRVKNKEYVDAKEERFSFMVSYFAEGKRKQRMFADFDEAHSEAKSVGKSISNGELDVLELRSRDRSAYTHAIAALEPTGIALELAAKEFAEAWKILGGRASLVEAAKEYVKRNTPNLPIKLIPDAVKDMLEAKEAEGASAVYMKVLKFYLTKFADVFHSPLRSLTTAEIGDFLRNMKGSAKGKNKAKQVSARSKNNARQTLGAFFKFCKERGWLSKDHDGIALVPKFKEQANDIEIFTPLEVAHFLAYCRPEMVPFVAIGAFAGLRSAEIERLDWSEVHLADRFIEVKAAKAKTASRRIVPMTENLAKWLTSHAETEGRVVPFDNVNKQIGWMVEDTTAGLKKAAKQAGKDPEKVKAAVWKKNALRHSFISYRVADTQNVNQTALECGNSSAVIFKHYRELVRPADAKKWFSIEPKADAKITPMPATAAA